MVSSRKFISSGSKRVFIFGAIISPVGDVDSTNSTLNLNPNVHIASTSSNENYRSKCDDLFNLFAQNNTVGQNDSEVPKLVDNIQFLGALTVASRLSPSEKLTFIRKHLLLDVETRSLDIGAILIGTSIAYDQKNMFLGESVSQYVQRHFEGNKTDENLLHWLSNYVTSSDTSRYDCISLKEVRNMNYSSSARFVYIDEDTGKSFGGTSVPVLNSNRVLNTIDGNQNLTNRENSLPMEVNKMKTLHQIPARCKRIRIEMYLESGLNEFELKHQYEHEQSDPICEVSVDLFNIQASAATATDVSQWLSFSGHNAQGEILIHVGAESPNEPSLFTPISRNIEHKTNLKVEEPIKITNVKVNPYFVEWVIGYEPRVPALYLASGKVVYSSSQMVVVHDPKSHSQYVYGLNKHHVSCIAVHPNGKFVASMERGSNAVHIWDASKTIDNRIDQHELLLTSFEVISSIKSAEQLIPKILFTEENDSRLLVILDSNSGIISIYDWFSNGVLLFSERLNFVATSIAVRSGLVVVSGEEVAILKLNFINRNSKFNPKDSVEITHGENRNLTFFKLFSKEAPDFHLSCITLTKSNIRAVVALTGTKSGNLCVWTENKCEKIIRNAHSETVKLMEDKVNTAWVQITALAELSPNRIASADNYGIIKTWDSRTVEAIEIFRPFKAFQEITGMCPIISGTGLLITTFEGPLCSIHLEGKTNSLVTTDPENRLDKSNANIFSFATVNQVLQSTSEASSISVYMSAKPSKVLSGHYTKEREQVPIYAAISSGVWLSIWCVSSKRVKKKRSFAAKITSLTACSSTSVIAVATSDDTVFYLDADSLEIVDSFSTTANQALCFSSDGKLLACGKGRIVQVYHLNRLIASLKTTHGAALAVSNVSKQGFGDFHPKFYFFDENRKLHYRSVTWETKSWKILRSDSGIPAPKFSNFANGVQTLSENINKRVLNLGSIGIQLQEQALLVKSIEPADIDYGAGFGWSHSGVSESSPEMPLIPSWVYGHTLLRSGRYLHPLTDGSSKSLLYPAGCYVVIAPISATIKAQRYFTMPNKSEVLTLAMSPDQKVVATCSVQEIVIWNTQNLCVLQRIDSANTISLSFLGPNFLVAANQSSLSMYFWKSGYQMDSLAMHEIGSSGKLIEICCVYDNFGDKKRILNNTVPRKSQVVILYENAYIQVWNTRSRSVSTWEIVGNCICETGLVGTKTGDLYLLDLSLSTSKIRSSLSRCCIKKAHGDSIVAICEDPKGGYISSGVDKEIKWWSNLLEPGLSISVTNIARCIAKSSFDSRLFLSVDDGSISYWASGSALGSSKGSAISSLTTVSQGFGFSHVDMCVFGEDDTICVVGDNSVFLAQAGNVRCEKLNIDVSVKPRAIAAFEFDRQSIIIAVALDNGSILLFDIDFHLVGRGMFDKKCTINSGSMRFVQTMDENTLIAKKKLYLVIEENKTHKGLPQKSKLIFEIAQRNPNATNAPFSPTSYGNTEFDYELKRVIHHTNLKNNKQKLLLDAKPPRYNVFKFQGGLLISNYKDKVNPMRKKSENADTMKLETRNSAQYLQNLQAAQKTLRWIFSGGYDPSFNVACSLVYYLESTVIIQKPIDEGKVQEYLHHEAKVQSMSMNAAGTLVATSTVECVYLWDANSCVQIMSINCNRGIVKFSPDSKDRLAVLAVEEGRVYVYESFPPGSSKKWHILYTTHIDDQQMNRPSPQKLQWLNTSTILACNTLIFIETGERQLVPGLELLKMTCVVDISSKNIQSISGIPTNNSQNRRAEMIIGTKSGKLHILDLWNGDMTKSKGFSSKSVDAHVPQQCTCLLDLGANSGNGFTGNAGTVLSGGMDGKIILWGENLSKQLRVLEIHAPVRTLTYARSARGFTTASLVIGCSNMDILELNLLSWRYNMIQHSCMGNVKVAPNPLISNVVATVGRDLCLRLWDTKLKELIHVERSLPSPDSEYKNVVTMLWNPDGGLLGIATEVSVILVICGAVPRTNVIEIPSINQDNENFITDLKFSDNIMVVSTCKGEIIIFHRKKEMDSSLSGLEDLNYDYVASFQVELPPNQEVGLKSITIDIGRDRANPRTVLQVYVESIGNLYYDIETQEQLKTDEDINVAWQSYTSPVGWRIEGAISDKKARVRNTISATSLSHSTDLALFVNSGKDELSVYRFPCAPDVQSLATFKQCDGGIQNARFLGDDQSIVCLTNSALYIHSYTFS